MAGFAEILGNLPVGRSNAVAAAAGAEATHAQSQGEGSGDRMSPNTLEPGAVAGSRDNREEILTADSWEGQPDSGADTAEYGDLRGYLWSQLVMRLQAGEPKAMEELYSMFSNGVRFYLARQLAPDEIEDRLHDAFVIVVDAIRAGELRDPRRLMGFIRTVVKRIVVASIDRHVAERRGRVDDERSSNMMDRSLTPERALLFQQQTNIVREVLAELSERDRQILKRFYVDEQPAQDICRVMNLTMTQFRLLKSRAKNRFGELGKKKVQKSGLSQVLLRFSRT